jgi:hypothetical protein
MYLQGGLFDAFVFQAVFIDVWWHFLRRIHDVLRPTTWNPQSDIPADRQLPTD